MHRWYHSVGRVPREERSPAITVAFSEPYKNGQTRNALPVPSCTKKALNLLAVITRIKLKHCSHGIHRARDRLSKYAARPLCVGAA